MSFISIVNIPGCSFRLQKRYYNYSCFSKKKTKNKKQQKKKKQKKEKEEKLRFLVKTKQILDRLRQ